MALILDRHGRPLREPVEAPAPETREIATTRDGRDITRGYVDALPYLQPTDRVLRLRGGLNYETYEEVLRDDQVHSTFTQRRMAVVSKPVKVTPGGERRIDRQAAEFIEAALERIRFDTVTERMLYGRFYGYAVAEALWAREGERIVLERLKVRNRRRFVFDGDFRPKLLTTANPNGEELPERKFWWFSTGADHDDEPYGLGLAHWLYWPVFFKRTQTRYWLVFLEKYGQPTTVGKWSRRASEAEKRQLLQAQAALRADTGIAIPDDMAIELLEAKRSGEAGYAALYDRLDAAIAKVVLGQTMTTEDGSSLAQAQVHMAVRDDIVAADAHLVCDSFNRSIVKWLTEWNFPRAAYPTVSREMADAPDLHRLAVRDKLVDGMLARQGLALKPGYLEDTYAVETAPRAMPPGPGKEPAPSPGSAALAEPDADALERALDAIDAEDWAALSSPLVKPILERAKAEPEDLMTDLASLYPELDADALTEQLARLLFAADAWGRLEAGESDG